MRRTGATASSSPAKEPLSSRFGSLVFTGVEDDPETLATLRADGVRRSPRGRAPASAPRHHGHIAATRTERGRELFTRLAAPRLLDADRCRHRRARRTDVRPLRRFLLGPPQVGVQVQSLFLAQPKLLELILGVMAVARRRWRSRPSRRARRPLIALLDPAFFRAARPRPSRSRQTLSRTPTAFEERRRWTRPDGCAASGRSRSGCRCWAGPPAPPKPARPSRT